MIRLCAFILKTSRSYIGTGANFVLINIQKSYFLFQVAWVRIDTQTILSIHHSIITQNPRITLTHNEHRSWYLHIKDVQEEDRGWYMCQINTDPMRSRQGYLQVVGKFLENKSTNTNSNTNKTLP